MKEKTSPVVNLFDSSSKTKILAKNITNMESSNIKSRQPDSRKVNLHHKKTRQSNVM